ncbi:aldose 1-epimerase [Paenibacillus hexagrammi]|uniref:Aldose 1-epimerase n=1 Tax=Paenibacillus hexagrammi TaxID=2908839 RepID=A0ABY3SP11_9BACL|nr:aldose 1-epimerase [Paenibacillus sp. YPD9-1]UJF35567.1 aldose 1-epimerase [Paenibacillus sp. YPD9-1]
MSRYTAQSIMKEGYSVIVLNDAHHDATAEVIPEAGNNLYRFESGGHEVILQPVSLKMLRNEPFANFKYGTPILFPPNRVKNGRFIFRGRTYCFPLNEPPSNHLHGEICSRAWEVLEYGATEELGAYVVSRFRYELHSDIMAYFPHSITFTFTYRLFEGRLHLNGTIVNEGEDEAPFAFGLHPYFSIPFDGGEELMLTVPAMEEWPVTNEAFVTGRPSITPFSRSLKEGVAISSYPQLGCSLLSLEEEDGNRVCRLEMKDRGYSIAYQIDRQFPFMVLFRPDWASAFSLEPYTAVTDAFNLPYEHELTGVRGIRSREEVSFRTCLWVDSFL